VARPDGEALARDELARCIAASVEGGLLPALRLHSAHPHEPVVVESVPPPWQLVGAGNYAAVFAHPDYEAWVVKVYAPGREGIGDEACVYRALGAHPAFSEMLYEGERYLVLRRLRGVTLWDSVRRGIDVPERAVRDVDEALVYARSRGLNPMDVHGKNVMVHEGRGVVVDVSDFLRRGDCTRWSDLRRAYFALYAPLRPLYRLPVPLAALDAVRRGYRLYRGVRRLAGRRDAAPSGRDEAGR
jgi:hypothetical protein